MIPVPQSSLKNVFSKMLPSWLEDTNLGGRVDSEQFLEGINAGYTSRRLSAYTDSLENPTYWLVLGVDKSFMLSQPTCLIHVIYGLKEGDGSARKLKTKEAMDIAEAYARLHGCGDLMAASWTYLGAKDSSSLWEANEFDPQETTYIKLL